MPQIEFRRKDFELIILSWPSLYYYFELNFIIIIIKD